MTRLRRAINLTWLGIRTVRGRDGSLGPAVATVFGVGLAAAVILSLLSAWGAAQGYRDRVAARTPVENGTDGPGAAVRNTVRIDGEILTIYAVAGEAPAPPGLANLPRPGEIYASPALVDAAKTNQHLARLTEGRRLFAIAPEGLARPDELVAWVGVERDEMRDGLGFSRYGNDAVLPPFLREPGWTVFFGASAALAVLVPLLLVATASARVNAGLRERRLFALRVLGLGRARAAVLPLVEVGALALSGGLLGAGVHQLLMLLATRGAVFGISVFREDVDVGPRTVGLVVAGVWFFTVVVAAMPTLKTIGSIFTTRPSLHVRRPRRRPMALLVGSVAALVVLLVIPSEWAQIAQSGVIHLLAVTFIVGLVGGIGSLVAWLASKAVHHANRPETLVALRRLETSPDVASRYLLGFAVMLFAVVATGGVVDAMADSPAFVDEMRALQFSGETQLVFAEHVPGRRDLTAELGGDGVKAVTPYVLAGPVTGGEANIEVILADCDALRRLARRTVEACPSGAAMIAAGQDDGAFVGDLPPPPEAEPLIIRTLTDREVSVLPAEDPIDLGITGIDPFGGWFIVDPAFLGVAPEELKVAGYVAALEPTPEAADRFRLHLLAAAPASRLFVPGESGVLGARSFAPIARYLTVLLGVGAALVLISVAVVGLQMVAERQTRALLAIGAPRRVLWRIEMLMLMFPAVVGLTIAIGGGAVITEATEKVFDSRGAPIHPAVLYLIALALAACIAAYGARRVARADPTHIGPGD